MIIRLNNECRKGRREVILYHFFFQKSFLLMYKFLSRYFLRHPIHTKSDKSDCQKPNRHDSPAFVLLVESGEPTRWQGTAARSTNK